MTKGRTGLCGSPSYNTFSNDSETSEHINHTGFFSPPGWSKCPGVFQAEHEFAVDHVLVAVGLVLWRHSGSVHRQQHRSLALGLLTMRNWLVHRRSCSTRQVPTHVTGELSSSALLCHLLTFSSPTNQPSFLQTFFPATR